MKKIKLLSAVIALVMAFSMSAAAIDTLTYDFNEDFPGDHANFTEMGKFWVETIPAAGGAVITEGEDGNYLKFYGYSELKTCDVIEGEYVFSVDMKTNEASAAAEQINHGMFIRGILPEHLVKNNKIYGDDWPLTPHYYESDWYAVWEGQHGSQGLGGSGIFFSPVINGLSVGVKTFAEDALNIATLYTTIPYPDGVYYDDFFNLKIYDNGTDLIEIFINDAAFATIELSEAGVTYEIDNNAAGDEYFGKAVIKDATGAELTTVEKTRINSQSSQLAFATRGGDSFELLVDDVTLITGEGAIESDKGTTDSEETEAPVAGETEAPAADETKAPAADETKAPTTGDAATTTAGDSDSEEGGNTTTIIIVVVAVVAVIAVGAIVIAKKKK